MKHVNQQTKETIQHIQRKETQKQTNACITAGYVQQVSILSSSRMMPAISPQDSFQVIGDKKTSAVQEDRLEDIHH